MAFTLLAAIVAPLLWSFFIQPLLLSYINYSNIQNLSTWVGMPVFVGGAVYMVGLFFKGKTPKDSGV